MHRIENLDLIGPAGRIEGMLKRPAAGDPAAAAVLCHPHPLFGGTMHNKVVHAVAEALADSGVAVLRFNFRGVGRSGGEHDAGRGEQDDFGVVLDHLASRFPGVPLLAAGYSFGSWVALRRGCPDARVVALLAVGLPVGLTDFRFLQACGKPLAIIQGEADEFGPLPLVMTLAASLPGGARVLVVKGAAHNFAGQLDELQARVREAVTEVLPAKGAPETA